MIDACDSFSFPVGALKVSKLGCPRVWSRLSVLVLSLFVGFASSPPCYGLQDDNGEFEEFVEEAAGMESLDELVGKLQDDPNDLELKYRMCVQLVVAGRYQEALDHAMDILRTDRGFRDDLGRFTMIRVFALLGKGNEIATAYRRKMFNFMH